MFERYTEKARRAIFFARYEASNYGGVSIEAEHVLLGILREYAELSRRLPVEAIREQITRRFPKTSVSTAVDLPLDSESKRALAKAAEAADRLEHRDIDCGHLLLGLMQESNLVSTVLAEHGIERSAIEDLIANPPMLAASRPERPDHPDPKARRLLVLIYSAEAQLLRFTESAAEDHIGKKRWSRKEALGHLIDCAATHLHWIARALTEPKPTFLSEPQDEWISAMGYKTFPWREMAPLWVSLNGLLAHAIAGIPESRAGVLCRIGIQEPLPLSALIDRYLTHCEEVMAEILSLGHLRAELRNR